MSRVLFADLLQPKLDILKPDGKGTYWSQLQALIASYTGCPSDWVIRFKTDRIRRERQYDKSEPVITYYLFTALSLATDQFRQADKLRGLFSRAFLDAADVEEVVSHLAKCGWAGLRYEARVCPTQEHCKAIQANVSSLPIGYLREVALKRPGVRFESSTHMDVCVQDQAPSIDGRGEIGFGVEAKFTSDIDTHTTYSTHRNQLIRNIEVGNGRFPRFYFVLIAPRMYFERRSRFYVYKAEEYRSDEGVAALQRDSLIKASDEAAKGWQQRFGILAWEDIVEVVFPGGQAGFDHSDAADLCEFLRQRGLLRERAHGHRD